MTMTTNERAVVEYEVNPNAGSYGFDVLREAILRSMSAKNSSLKFTVSIKKINNRSRPEAGANETEIFALLFHPVIYGTIVTVVIEGPHANAFIPTLTATLDELFAPRLTTSGHPATVDDNR